MKKRFVSVLLLISFVASAEITITGTEVKCTGQCTTTISPGGTTMCQGGSCVTISPGGIITVGLGGGVPSQGKAHL